MAQPQLQAQFFVDAAGVVTPRAGPLSSRVRQDIFRRDGGTCGDCGAKLTRFRAHARWLTGPYLAAVDHIFPRARGGQNNPANLRLLCESCNASKGAK